MGDPSDKASFHGAIILVVLIVVSLVVLLLSSTGKLLRHSSSSTTFAASLSQVPTTTTLSSSSSSLSATNLTAIARSGATTTTTIPTIPNATTTTTPSTYTTDTLSTSEFKVELRFPPTRVGQAAGKEEIIDLQSEEGNYDAGFVCKTFNVEKVLGPLHSQMDSHLVRVEPIVTEIQQYGSIVHHMDIFTCQDSVVQETLPLTTRSQQSDWCANDAFLKTSCKQVIWVYDRGAKKFTFPKEAGILFGPNSGFTHLILQIHYLLPELYIKQTGIGSVETPSATTGQQRGMIDSSGFEMIFNTKLRPHDSSIFGFLDFSMVIPPKTSTFVFENHVDSVSLAKMIAPDLLEFGQVHPFAVHLHAHNYAKSVKLEHYRDGVMLRT